VTSQRPAAEPFEPEPHDVAAEQCALGGMLLSKDAISDVIEVISPADHYRPAHQLIHEAVLGLYGRGEPVDAITVADELTRRGEIARVGGGPYLHTLIASVPTAAHAGYYARIVRDRAERREWLMLAARIDQQARNPEASLEDVRDLAAQAAEEGVRARGPGGAALRITPVSQIRVKATEWLWTNRIPLGALTLFPGREGTGKSTAGAWLAAKVTTGTLPGIYHGVPRGVFYAAREDDWERTIAPRLIAAKADISRVYRVDVEVSGDAIELVLPQHCELLRDGIRKYDIGMLFLDPLMSVISGTIDTHKDREARIALEPLSALAMDTDCGVVGLAHFNKAITTDALNLVMASKAFTAVPRAVIGMARDDEADEENTVVMSQIKSNLGPLDVPSLKFTFQQVTVETEDGRGAHVGRLVEMGETDRSVSDILAGRGDADDQETWNAACWWLYDYLVKRGGETQMRDVVADGKTAGQSKDSLKRASKKLALVKRTDGFQGPSMWIFDPQRSRRPAGASHPAAGTPPAPRTRSLERTQEAITRSDRN
jgi:hypothetical protein